MPEYSNYLEGLTPVVGALSGDEIIGASKDGGPVSITSQQITNLAGGTSIPYGVTTGINTYAVVMTPTVTSYVDGQLYHIRIGTSSTGLVTLNFDILGAKKVLKTSGAQVSTAHFLQNVEYLVSYNSALDGGTGAFVVVNELIHGFMNARGDYDASSNLFPSAGGSGVSGGIRHGDIFRISVAGTLGGNAVNIGDFVTTSVDNPGQTASSWYIIPGYNTVGRVNVGNLLYLYNNFI